MDKIRSEVDDSYKWDIDNMIPEGKKIEKIYEEIDELCNKILSYKGTILDSSTNLINVLNYSNQLDRLCENLYVYSHMLCDTDTKNNEYQSLKIKSENIYEMVSNKLSFINPEILKNEYSLVQKYVLENEDLNKYQFYFELMFRYKEHTLNESEEEIISKAINSMNVGSEVFYNLDNADIKIGSIKDENNNEVEITNSNYNVFMNNKDRRIRKESFEKLYSFYENHINTFAASLKGNVKKNDFISNVRKFNNPLENSLYADNINVSVYKNLIDTVHKKLNSMYEYMNLKKKFLKLEELHMYDIYVDLVDGVEDRISFEEGKKMIFESLKPLGDKYIQDLNKPFDEKWIDVYPNVGKKSGAYSWGTYDSKSYILLNYNDTIDSVSTMAHELGHSMHSYYSKNNQDYIYYNYPIFLAEIASTVNEVLLNDYLYKNSKNKKEKLFYLNEILEKIRTTIFRQTMFAEFEMIIYEKESKGISLTATEISNTYLDLNKLYYGDNVVSDDLIKYEWSRIPHFYNSFYVYKYATGLSAALAIASEILNGNKDVKDKYLEFLASGGKDYPLNTLNKLGIDMTKTETIEKALDFFKKKLEELKQLV